MNKDALAQPVKLETIAEFLKRGGTITVVPKRKTRRPRRDKLAA